MPIGGKPLKSRLICINHYMTKKTVLGFTAFVAQLFQGQTSLRIDLIRQGEKGMSEL